MIRQSIVLTLRLAPRNIQPTKCKPLSGLALKLLAAGMANINREF